MAFYYTIDNSNAVGRRTAKKLLELRAGLDAQLPVRTREDTLLLATWNIREFDANSYGKRSAETLHYIAEIISRFDIVAIQEVRADLKALKAVQKKLGWYWKYIVTDVTGGRRGNNERMAYLYDARKIRFTGMAGELVVPPTRKKVNGKKTAVTPANQLYRTPFMVTFQAGWFKFMLCTVHILYGEGVADNPQRIAEVEAVASFLKKLSKKGYEWAKNIILLGDFNIFHRQTKTMAALKKHGFKVPKLLQTVPGSNVKKDKTYDQIACRVVKTELKPLSAGVFDFFEYVYRLDEEAVYKKAQGKYKSYQKWRTYQMSDHLPMWVELKIDFGEEYLESKTKA